MSRIIDRVRDAIHIFKGAHDPIHVVSRLVAVASCNFTVRWTLFVSILGRSNGSAGERNGLLDRWGLVGRRAARYCKIQVRRGTRSAY